jgi:pterin-4a-carbinolamine dehydratase
VEVDVRSEGWGYVNDSTILRRKNFTLAAYNPSTAMAAMAKKAKKAKGIPHHPKISSIVKEQRNKKV